MTARLRAEAELKPLLKSLIGTDDLVEARRLLRDDPAKRFESAEHFQGEVEVALERMRSAMPRWFGNVPETDLVIEPMSAEQGRGAAAAAYRRAREPGDPGGGGAVAGFGDQRNFELLVEAGFEPVEALQVMTLNGARLLGVQDQLGSIEVGKGADLVILRGDISSDPSAIRNVITVFKDGVGYDSAGLIRSVRGNVGIR